MFKTLASLFLGLVLLSTSIQAQAIKSIQPSIDSLINPAVPFIQRYPILPIYYPWIVQLAACEGLSLPPIEDFVSFKLYEVNATAFEVNHDTTSDYLAMTVAREHIIYFSIAHVFDKAVVLHEFLHVLLFYTFPDGRYTGVDPKLGPIKNHPPKYFLHCGVNNNY